MKTLFDKACVVAGALLVLLMLTTAPAHAQRVPGAVGVGGQIGEPTGLTVKVYNPQSVSLDVLAAWNLDDFTFLNVHGLYERHLGNTSTVHFFYGPGAFVGFRDRPREQDDDAVAGLSGTIGLGVLVDRLEFYGQLTPRLELTPATNGDLGGGLGFRFYF